ncbi:LutC/YkgG family protein [Actinosynnema mirum]|uniref:LUD domain-containing protein n=1 Tax=Actinosynnema mirum (strain ATCC 29888 / DSM 43827 / JCM 3225 / NBRC 14064 / NCIMB 13271 / NRRL B-12336 / IMRU 3971 / 101) TaxID=446462 RepID=C6WRW3_ACTMD|nr:LUD domain-containing protein [Actinosynnema mirum]ACU36955.1 protein of unknown function DUF162 [Actinosynnema mirum DSM 43827]
MRGQAPARGSARTEVLARIRTALRDKPVATEVPRAYRRAGERGPGDVDLLAERLRDYRATVTFTSPADLPKTLSSLATGKVLAAPAIPQEWLPDAEREVTGLADLREFDAVVTCCRVAVAETGTIVLDHDAPDQAERAWTLVPDHHVVVVRRAQVVMGVPDAIAELTGVRTQTWISGPSATSDIELERVEGVHGPRQLDVVIV